MKVLLTTKRCTPHLTCAIVCDTMRYFDDKHEVRMYNAKGKVTRLAIADDWEEISYIDNNGQEHFIKRA